MFISATAAMPGRITTKGINIFGKAAISGVRRAADIEFGRHGALNDQKIRTPIAERKDEAQTGDQAEYFDAHRVLRGVARDISRNASSPAGVRDDMPFQPPAFITASMASGEKPSTMRKNCTTSL